MSVGTGGVATTALITGTSIPSPDGEGLESGRGVCVGDLCRFAAPDRLLGEERDLARLAVGGTLLVQTPNPLCLEALRSFFRVPDHRYPVDPELLRDLAEQAGLTFVHFCFTDPVGDRPAALELETVIDQPAPAHYRSCCAVLRKLDQQ